MTAGGRLVGRGAELERLTAALDRARDGAGGLVLLGGEAGVGKTRLAAALAEAAPDAWVLHGAALHPASTPYGPVVGALRTALRRDPAALRDCGPLAPHLAVVLPELGEPAPGTDRATLLEAFRCALAHLAAERVVLVLLEDLHWSDEATLELLRALAEPLGEHAVLVVATYRPEGLPRDHGLRRLRHELRRAGLLDEVALRALEAGETAELVAEVLGERAAPALARLVHDATQGTPFFAQELAAALRSGGALRSGPRGLEPAALGELPLPETVRDAVLVNVAELSAEGRAAAEAAAVAGQVFDLEQVGALSSPAGVAELVERGLARETGDGLAAFPHALTREALYADVPWLQRRRLHRALAEEAARTGAPSVVVAAHWLGAREDGPARDALLRVAQEAEEVHAFRDAAEAAHRALDLWPPGDQEPDRAAALERYGRCAELAGETAEAARAWRELTDLREGAERARAQQRLAWVLDLRGEREPAFAARRTAAEGFAAHGMPAEAAQELLIMANAERGAARYGDAIALAGRATEQADLAGRLDLRLRAQGIGGLARAKHDDYAAGHRQVRDALAAALEHDLSVVAAELYQRLSVTLYESADWGGAEAALETALDLCPTEGAAGVEVACVTCMAYVLRERGEWARAAQMCRDMVASDTAAWVAEGLLGAIHGAEGRVSSARRLLESCLAVATRVDHYNMTVDATAALARVAAAEGALDEARDRCRALLARWEASDDRHYAIAGLRWSTGFLAAEGDVAGARECAGALGRIASQTGHPDALAALACAIGETALLDGQPDAAAEQLTRAAELHADLDLPFERAQIELRAGVALAAAGHREPALERLDGAYRAARRLGARPLAAEAAREVAALGESVSGRLGVRAQAYAEGAGLSRRELQVVRLVAVGRTNQEIADDLFLSRRTVDMHVRNILRKLGCRSRVEAAHRAGDLGLLAA